MMVCSDLHLQVTPPRCRTESEEGWLAYQKRILDFIVDTTNNNDTDLYIVGDIFDKAVSNPILSTMFVKAMNRLRHFCFIMPGNHCLPNHSTKEIDRSSFGVLNALTELQYSKIKSIGQGNYAYVPFDNEDSIVGNPRYDILFVHRLVFPSTGSIPPGSDGITARTLVDKYPQAKMIVCGDNHSKFTMKIDNTVVVNCGCVTKRNILFKDMQLAIHMINPIKYTAQEMIIPDDSVLVEDSRVMAKRENEDKFMELVELLKKSGNMTLDYVANLKARMATLSDGAQEIFKEMGV